MRSFIRLRAVDPGFRAEGVLTVRVPLSGGRNSAPQRRVAFFRQVTERIALLPGVKDVGAVNSLPMTGLGVGATFVVEGRPLPPAERRPMALARSVMPGYFKTMGIPLLSGRVLADSDSAQSQSVVLVNQTLARRFWPGTNAVGGRLSLDQQARVAEVVGVVGDVKAERVDGEDWPTIYSAYAQVPTSSMTLVLHGSGSPMGWAAAVRKEVAQLDAEQPVADVRSMEAVVDLAMAGSRFNTVLLVTFAAIAFVLAAVGIYGVVSYDVNRRTNEIGSVWRWGRSPKMCAS
jgi:putative ABC transport system permease protein